MYYTNILQAFPIRIEKPHDGGRKASVIPRLSFYRCAVFRSLSKSISSTIASINSPKKTLSVLRHSSTSETVKSDCIGERLCKRQKETVLPVPLHHHPRCVGHINAPSGGAKPLNHCLVWMKGKDNY